MMAAINVSAPGTVDIMHDITGSFVGAGFLAGSSNTTVYNLINSVRDYNLINENSSENYFL